MVQCVHETIIYLIIRSGCCYTECLQMYTVTQINATLVFFNLACKTILHYVCILTDFNVKYLKPNKNDIC